MKVRKAELSDLKEILDIVKGTFPQDFFYEGGFNKGKCAEFFMKSLTDPNEFVYICLEDGGKVCAFAYYVNKPPTNGTVILEMQGVSKKFRYKGIGTRLLEESDKLVVEDIKSQGIENLATIHLTVSQNNLVAQKLYENVWYKPVGTIPGFVGNGNNEIVMLKVVNDINYRRDLWTSTT